jgi:hypothetical protein
MRFHHNRHPITLGEKDIETFFNYLVLKFGQNLILVRGGKCKKDRITVHPETLIVPLKQHLHWVERVNQIDLSKDLGILYLPYALERKFPNAHQEWIWQYALPSNKFSRDPRSDALAIKSGVGAKIANLASQPSLDVRIKEAQCIWVYVFWHLARNSYYLLTLSIF